MMHLKIAMIAFTSILVIGSAQIAYSQHDPQLSLYMFNKHVYNPGFTGMEGALSGVGAFRTQWTGFDGRPVTQSISVHSPAGNTLGFGGYIINDMAGVDRTTSFSGSISFRKQFTFGTISLGVAGGLLQQALDGALYEPSDSRPDPNIPRVLVTAQAPDFAIGLYINDEVKQRYFGGISMTHLTAPQLAFDIPGNPPSTLNLEFNRTIYATGGYRFTLSRNFDLQPSVLLKSDLVKAQFDLNANLVYKSSLITGLSLRGVTTTGRDAVVAIVGMNLSQSTFIAYSYDMTLSALGNYSSGSHEFILSYLLDYTPPVKLIKVIYCPRFL